MMFFFLINQGEKKETKVLHSLRKSCPLNLEDIIDQLRAGNAAKKVMEAV